MSSWPPDLWIITCYYNPGSFQTKRKNYERFVAALKSVEARYRVVECAFEDARFELPDGPTAVRVRGGDILWQKERLLNLALTSLPSSCTKVAWLDCDLLFENPSWMKRTSEALEAVEVVQPYTHVVRLPRGPHAKPENGKAYRSFAAVQSAAREAPLGSASAAHGHTGFAWAARRGWLSRHGLYDVCLAGSADHLMAHAFYGETDSRCTADMLGQAGPYRDHFEAWAADVYEEVGGRVGVIPGRVLHLWHGDLADRRYDLRNQQLQDLGFDPLRDLRLSKEGLWEWASPKPTLHQWARAFFALRNEDGTFRSDHNR